MLVPNKINGEVIYFPDVGRGIDGYYCCTHARMHMKHTILPERRPEWQHTHSRKSDTACINSASNNLLQLSLLARLPPPPCGAGEGGGSHKMLMRGPSDGGSICIQSLLSEISHLHDVGPDCLTHSERKKKKPKQSRTKNEGTCRQTPAARHKTYDMRRQFSSIDEIINFTKEWP